MLMMKMSCLMTMGRNMRTPIIARKIRVETSRMQRECERRRTLRVKIMRMATMMMVKTRTRMAVERRIRRTRMKRKRKRKRRFNLLRKRSTRSALDTTALQSLKMMVDLLFSNMSSRSNISDDG